MDSEQARNQLIEMVVAEQRPYFSSVNIELLVRRAVKEALKQSSHATTIAISSMLDEMESWDTEYFQRWQNDRKEHRADMFVKNQTFDMMEDRFNIMRENMYAQNKNSEGADNDRQE